MHNKKKGSGDSRPRISPAAHPQLTWQQ